MYKEGDFVVQDAGSTFHDVVSMKTGGCNVLRRVSITRVLVVILIIMALMIIPVSMETHPPHKWNTQNHSSSKATITSRTVFDNGTEMKLLEATTNYLVFGGRNALYNVSVTADGVGQLVKVNWIMEMATVFNEDVFIISCDNKDKVPTDIPGESHHIRPKGMHLVDQAPNLPDHSFPTSKVKLNPSGYMLIEPKLRRSRSARKRAHQPISSPRARSWSPRRRNYRQSYFDKCNRERIQCFRSGELLVYISSDYFQKATSTLHLNNLLDFLPSKFRIFGKSNLVLICDGGPDWTGDSLLNLLVMSRLWIRLNLENLIMVRYCPNHSKYNPIERRWGPLTKKLAGVVIPFVVPGEHVSPFQQSLCDVELNEKVAAASDNAIDMLGKFYEGDSYDGFGCKVSAVYANANETWAYSHKERSENQRLVQNVSRKSMDSNPQLLEELRFALSHVQRTSYCVQFSRCINPSCICQGPIPNLLSPCGRFLRDIGGFVPTPVEDDIWKGHFLSFLQNRKSSRRSDLDRFLPSGRRLVCDKHCRYVFRSNQDRRRHELIMHL